jgi:hypothetical protein
MYRAAGKMRGFFPFGKLRVRMTISSCITVTVKMLELEAASNLEGMGMGWFVPRFVSQRRPAASHSEVTLFSMFKAGTEVTPVVRRTALAAISS